MSLDSIRHISAIQRQRCARWHSLESWSPSDWGVALAGEVGELCNVIKKLNRVRDGIVGNKPNEPDLGNQLASEIADVYLYLDLLAQRMGVDLYEAVRIKFNETSIRMGFPEQL